MYDKRPFVQVSQEANSCRIGWPAIADALQSVIPPLGRAILCVECYPGVFVDEISTNLSSLLAPALLVNSEASLRASKQIEQMLEPWLTEDPVFGRINGLGLADLLDPEGVNAARKQIANVSRGLILVIGTGASLVAQHYDLLVYADMARWEIQQRQRRGEAGNLGSANYEELPSLKYKRSYFVDWRLSDRLKQKLLPCTDFLLDTNDRSLPKLLSGEALRGALAAVVERPFRVVPFFDPGPWGGSWMRDKFDLPDDVPNYAWCFDCVPEENSLLLGYGESRVEVPAVDLVFLHATDLLGPNVVERFGAEFPIRFDFLDTVGGGNLSLQVHPLAEYIRKHFGLAYTQDESYYMLDTTEDAYVYLGLKEGIDAQSMFCDLEAAQAGKADFPADRYVNRFTARKHDHFLIPAGTVHCSGRGSMVLEVSATPYIFTFKLWDWGRLGLDGRPRPIHLEHGFANIQWNRTTRWVEESLINRVELIAAGDGWREERTGLHEMQFIETRRHWFTNSVPHETQDTVNVLNLVEGAEAIVESPTGAFEPFPVHYAETFIVPAKVGRYTIRPCGKSEGRLCATIKAFVRADLRNGGAPDS